MSPSTRRAWIEIAILVDCGRLRSRSPSTRRAWIEIQMADNGIYGFVDVALHPEGVDRNAPTVSTLSTNSSSRPPPGGRG